MNRITPTFLLFLSFYIHNRCLYLLHAAFPVSRCDWILTTDLNTFCFSKGGIPAPDSFASGRLQTDDDINWIILSVLFSVFSVFHFFLSYPCSSFSPYAVVCFVFFTQYTLAVYCFTSFSSPAHWKTVKKRLLLVQSGTRSNHISVVKFLQNGTCKRPLCGPSTFDIWNVWIANNLTSCGTFLKHFQILYDDDNLRMSEVLRCYSTLVQFMEFPFSHPFCFLFLAKWLVEFSFFPLVFFFYFSPVFMETPQRLFAKGTLIPLTHIKCEFLLCSCRIPRTPFSSHIQNRRNPAPTSAGVHSESSIC